MEWLQAMFKGWWFLSWFLKALIGLVMFLLGHEVC